MSGRFTMLNIRPWWARLFVLMLIGSPVFTGWPINGLAIHAVDLLGLSGGPDAKYYYQLYELVFWVTYACGIWGFVYFNTGATRFWEYMIVGFFFGLTTAISGAVVRKLLPFLSGGAEAEMVSFK